MGEHSATATVHAPVHQAYKFFTHFDNYPRFLSFVKNVTYHDSDRSHWVADLLGRDEWDAVNRDWKEDQSVGWSSTSGFKNTGTITFQQDGQDQTRITMQLNFETPSGVQGDEQFQTTLEKDLNDFAQWVNSYPQGALDPHSPHYLLSGKRVHPSELTLNSNVAPTEDYADMKRREMQNRNTAVAPDVEVDPNVTADTDLGLDRDYRVPPHRQSNNGVEFLDG
ncbi:MAG TPA: SRPBCC family protein [Ktedonobacteraceae bacterium]|nr:SRPBCC family protein [Ktedonobacteraceae bacterium]